MTGYSIIKNLFYLVILSSFIGASVIAVDVNLFQLSLHRIVFLILTLIIFVMYFARLQSIEIMPQGKGRSIVVFFVLWFVYAVISVAWVKDYGSWIKAVYFIASGLLAIVYSIMFIKDKKVFVAVFYMMQVMVIMHNAIGWYEIITGDYRFMDTSEYGYRMIQYASLKYPVSMMGNTNDFAMFANFGVFVSFICFKNSRAVFGKLISIACIGSCIVLILMSDSRANLVGLILALGALFLLHLKDGNKILKFYLAVLIPVAIIAVFPAAYENIQNMLTEKLQFNFASSALGSDVIRLNLIKNGFVFLTQTFGFGTGAGNIEFWMTHWGYNTGYIVNMHNWWMELLTGYGVFVFAGYIWIYVKLVNAFFTAGMHNEDKFIKNVSIGMLCFMIAFSIGSVSSSSNIGCEWLWMVWGVVVAMYCYINNGQGEPSLPI